MIVRTKSRAVREEENDSSRSSQIRVCVCPASLYCIASPRDFYITYQIIFGDHERFNGKVW